MIRMTSLWEFHYLLFILPVSRPTDLVRFVATIHLYGCPCTRQQHSNTCTDSLKFIHIYSMKDLNPLSKKKSFFVNSKFQCNQCFFQVSQLWVVIWTRISGYRINSNVQWFIFIFTARMIFFLAFYPRLFWLHLFLCEHLYRSGIDWVLFNRGV